MPLNITTCISALQFEGISIDVLFLTHYPKQKINFFPLWVMDVTSGWDLRNFEENSQAWFPECIPDGIQFE